MWRKTMPADQTGPRRHSIRLPDYDYRQAGFYFVTICTQDHKCLLGSIVQGEMYPNNAGAIAKSIWDSLSGRFAHVGLDVYCMMPNHLHGILVLEERSKVSLGEI